MQAAKNQYIMLVCHRNVLHQAHDFQPKEKPMMAKENVDLLDEKYHYHLNPCLEVEQTRSDKNTSQRNRGLLISILGAKSCTSLFKRWDDSESQARASVVVVQIQPLSLSWQ